MSDPGLDTAGLPVHRSEALTDGIYAVAMTLLVIELKLPESAHASTSAELAEALLHLAPKAMAWAISFLVLAFFWAGHHRAYAHLRRSDGKLVFLNLLQLAFVSLMPFSCALLGESSVLLAQVIYSGNMILLCVVALLSLRHIHSHPELSRVPMPAGRYRSAHIRIGGLIVISLVAVGIGAVVPWPGAGNMAFMLMALIGRLARAAEQRATVPMAVSST